MFCIHCGAKFEAEGAFCQSCGKPRSNEISIQPNSPAGPEATGLQPQPEAPATTAATTGNILKNKKVILIALVALAILIKMGIINVTPIVGNVFNSKATEPRMAVERLFKGILEEDTKLFLSAFPQRYIQEMQWEYTNYYSDDYMTFEAYLRDQLSDARRYANMDGIYSMKDIRIIQPTDYKTSPYTSVQFITNGESEWIDVIKIDGQWYVDESIF